MAVQGGLRFCCIIMAFFFTAPTRAQHNWFDEDYEYEHTANDGWSYEDVVTNGHYRNFAPIHIAAARGDIKTILQELEDGVNVDLRVNNKGGSSWWKDTTPLMWAAICGRPEAVQVLLDAMADIEAKSANDVTALMAAAGAMRMRTSDPAACLKILLDARAKIDVRDSQRRTALIYACSDGSHFFYPRDDQLPEEFRFPDPFEYLRPGVGGLIGAGTSGRMSLQATRYGDAIRVKMLIDAGADVNAASSWGGTPLMAASQQADPERVQLLLKAGGKVDAAIGNGGTPLTQAATYANLAVFKVMLEAAGDLSDEVMQEVVSRVAGSMEDSGEKIKLLMTAEPDVNVPDECGRSALHLSVSLSGDGTAIIPLLSAGADPIARLENGDTVLMAAARQSVAEGLAALLALDFNVNERSNEDGHPTPIMLAAGSNRDAAKKVKLLIESGSDIEMKDDAGNTPILYAARKGNMNAVIALAKAGAAVNMNDSGRRFRRNLEVRIDSRSIGMTPLMYVAYRGGDSVFMSEQTGEEAARLLIERGANVNAATANGMTALGLSLQSMQPEVGIMLLEAGATPSVEIREEIMEDYVIVTTLSAMAIERDITKTSG